MLWLYPLVDWTCPDLEGWVVNFRSCLIEGVKSTCDGPAHDRHCKKMHCEVQTQINPTNIYIIYQHETIRPNSAHEAKKRCLRVFKNSGVGCSCGTRVQDMNITRVASYHYLFMVKWSANAKCATIADFVSGGPKHACLPFIIARISMRQQTFRQVIT